VALLNVGKRNVLSSRLHVPIAGRDFDVGSDKELYLGTSLVFSFNLLLKQTTRSDPRYGQFFQDNPQIVEILIQERAAFRGSIPDTHLVYRRKNQGVLDDVLKRGIKAGEIRKINVRGAGDALANALYGTVVCGCLEGSSRNLRRMAEQAVDIFLNGILCQPARQN
jgi:hypothetical protein